MRRGRASCPSWPRSPPGGRGRVGSGRCAARISSGSAACCERLGEAAGRAGQRRRGAVGAVAVGVAGGGRAGGRRTILVECDLARPRLAADLGLAPAPGLHEYLRWEATPAEILQPLALAGGGLGRRASRWSASPPAARLPSPATLLGLQSFRHMAAKLRSAYELVVLSGPALGSDRPGAGGDRRRGGRGPRRGLPAAGLRRRRRSRARRCRLPAAGRPGHRRRSAVGDRGPAAVAQRS